MSELEMTGVVGYEQEIPGGWTFEIGNDWVSRRLHCIAGRIGTTSLLHGVSCEDYLLETVEEFSITLSRGIERRELTFREFLYQSHSLPRESSDERMLKIDLEADFDGSKLPVSLVYHVRAEDNFMRKWIEIPPTQIAGWVIEWVTIENLKFKEMVEGVVPLSRYPQTFANGEDNVHVAPDKVRADDTLERFDFGDRGRAVLHHWGLDEGLFFFAEHLLGSEAFDRPSGLVMRQKHYAPLSDGLTTGPAVIGAYSGPPQIGFKRYTNHLSRHWCVVNEKQYPISWNTWFITQKNDVPLQTNYDRALILDFLHRLRDAGFYEALHLDLGWEASWPLSPDLEKFPNGLDEIVRRAKEAGLDMAFWINPFSSNYWKSDVEDEHPEWLNQGKVSGQSGAHAICPMTDYFDHVKRSILDLVERYNARVIYWDGGDWNIPTCISNSHGHRSQHELDVSALGRLAELARAVHEARPETIIVGFNLPFGNHRLSSLDMEQVSDTYSFPTGRSEIIQRQQMHQMTFEHPFRAISSSWYGVDWLDAGEENLTKRPLRELIHAEMSMIANGARQAGASIDLARARPELVEFLRRMFAWRKRFERYFTVYQHILGFPDGLSVDGAGHIIDGKGFLVLVNPTESEQTIDLPLDEPELELSADEKYSVYDWSSLESSKFLGRAKIGDKFEIDFAPLEVKIVGIDVLSPGVG